MFILYKVISFLIYPFLYIYLLWRFLKGKEEKNRLLERFSITNKVRPNGKLIWFHAASVGECISIVPLIEYFLKHFATYNILVTSGTIDSAKLIKNKFYKQNLLHQYIPFDNYQSANKFVKYWNPALVIWTESEIWPNLLSRASEVANIILINGRMSKQSYNKWQKYYNFIVELLKKFSVILVQSKQDYKRFKKLGASNLYYTGNLKYSNKPKEPKKEFLHEIKKQIKNRIVFMAASTHHNEEEQIARVHKELKNTHKKLLTIIAPRHPRRLDKILASIKKIGGLKICVRSMKDKISENTDIYIADTIGEYNLFYNISEIVFVGGSLIPHGGQNIIEPANFNNAIITGRYMSNFQEVYNDFVKKRAIITVDDDKELALQLDIIIRDYKLRETYKKRAKLAADASNNVLNNVIEKIIPYCKGLR